MKAIFTIVVMVILNFIATFVLSLLSSLPFEMREIKTTAMLPTLRVNDLVFVEKFSPYLKQKFNRGEVVLFYPDFLESRGKTIWQKMSAALDRIKGRTGEKAYFRRVAGLAGDVVEIYCSEAKIVLPTSLSAMKNQINDTAPQAQDSVIKITCKQNNTLNTDQKCLARYTVPAGCLFLIGDNTDYLGILEDAKIFGRPQFRLSDGSKIEPQGTNQFVISKGEDSQ